MAIQLVAAPAQEPVGLEEARAQVRVDHRDEDALVAGLVAAARDHVERVTRRQLITATYRLTLDRFPRGAIALPRPPLLEIVKVEYFASTGELVTMDPGFYFADVTEEPGELLPIGAWPLTQDRPGAVRIEFRAGYGATPAEVPASIRQAILVLVAAGYEHREGAEAPPAVGWLLDPYRVLV